jgi:hypothetical protein
VFSHPIASMMAAQSTRRALTEPPREPVPPRRPRRAVALVLQRAAHRLDPCVTAAPRVTLGR